MHRKHFKCLNWGTGLSQEIKSVHFAFEGGHASQKSWDRPVSAAGQDPVLFYRQLRYVWELRRSAFRGKNVNPFFRYRIYYFILWCIKCFHLLKGVDSRQVSSAPRLCYAFEWCSIWFSNVSLFYLDWWIRFSEASIYFSALIFLKMRKLFHSTDTNAPGNRGDSSFWSRIVPLLFSLEDLASMPSKKEFQISIHRTTGRVSTLALSI